MAGNGRLVRSSINHLAALPNFARIYPFVTGWNGLNMTGVFDCLPKGNTAHRYRETVSLGHTHLGEMEVAKLLGELADEWPGRSYDLLRRNCCHFCDVLAKHLGVQPLPTWMNALAGKGQALATTFPGLAGKLLGTT